MNRQPRIGDTVHYIPNLVDDQPAPCRAAIVTDLRDPEGGFDPETGTSCVGLTVFEQSGPEVRQHVPNSEPIHRRGTWHWPERVEDLNSAATEPQMVTVHVAGSVLTGPEFVRTVQDAQRRYGGGTARS